MKIQMDYRASNGSSMASKTQKYMFGGPNETDALRTRIKYLTAMMTITGLVAAVALGMGVVLLFKNFEQEYKTSIWRAEVSDAFRLMREDQQKTQNEIETNIKDLPRIAGDDGTIDTLGEDLFIDKKETPTVVENQPFEIDVEILIDDEDVDGGSGSGECPPPFPPICPVSVPTCYSKNQFGCSVPVCCSSNVDVYKQQPERPHHHHH